MALVHSEPPVATNFLLINLSHCTDSCIWDPQVEIFDGLCSHGNSTENQGPDPMVPKTHWMLCQVTFHLQCLLLSDKDKATVLSQHILFIS